MKVNNILFDSNFEKKLKKYKNKLTPKERENLKEKLSIFKENIFDEKLFTHRLNGKLKDYYSFRITYKDRLRFKLLDNENVFFYDIGNHGEVY